MKAENKTLCAARWLPSTIARAMSCGFVTQITALSAAVLGAVLSVEPVQAF